MERRDGKVGSLSRGAYKLKVSPTHIDGFDLAQSLQVFAVIIIVTTVIFGKGDAVLATEVLVEPLPSIRGNIDIHISRIPILRGCD